MNDDIPLNDDTPLVEQMPEEPSAEQKMQQLTHELSDFKDKYLRLLAETDNVRKRMQKEKQEMTRFATEGVLTEILGPIDSLENALKCTHLLSDEMRSWALGFQMILNQFKEVLADHGVTAFQSEGMSFDPNLHYAIETEETDQQAEGTILYEFVKGYKSGERTLRPARVKVAKKPQLEKKELDNDTK